MGLGGLSVMESVSNSTPQTGRGLFSQKAPQQMVPSKKDTPKKETLFWVPACHLGLTHTLLEGVRRKVHDHRK